MIKINQLDYAYKKANPVFKALDLSLEAGRIHGLLGKNGAGKTTLLKLIAGLLLTQTDATSIDVMQHQPSARKVEWLQNIYFLPDSFRLPNISMQAFVKAYACFYPAFNHAALQTALAGFELNQTQKLNNLSHGQQKKFLLAFGFATGARLLLLDEPSNALDIPSKQQFRKLLTNYLSADRAIVIATHQVKDIENLVDSVVILDQGQVAFNQSHESANWHDLESLFANVLRGEIQ